MDLLPLRKSKFRIGREKGGGSGKEVNPSRTVFSGFSFPPRLTSLKFHTEGGRILLPGRRSHPENECLCFPPILFPPFSFLRGRVPAGEYAGGSAVPDPPPPGLRNSGTHSQAYVQQKKSPPEKGGFREKENDSIIIK